jgi:hypothetical protein
MVFYGVILPAESIEYVVAPAAELTDVNCRVDIVAPVPIATVTFDDGTKPALPSLVVVIVAAG